MKLSKKLLLISTCCLTFVCGTHAQNITPWTEQNSVLGLGYPVPIPVDTPEPFDGFRTYSGLFAKHQSMALNNDYITGQVVGQTIYDRDIWAYVLSDEDDTTKYGVKEGAMMANGGIHAREWQTPETVTGIIEAFNDNSQDQSFYQYLLENSTIITIPVNNVDGFLQTQRYPTENWFSNSNGVRDGRMRRKNMLGVDEILTTQADHLLGVDLNRNNAPYWATTNASSSNVTSQVYHGSAVNSEPETLARLNAASLVDFEQLRVYTDVHSFSQVHFSKFTFNQNRNVLQSRLLADFSNFHRAFPAAKVYVDLPDPAGTGIGTTADYFASIYEIPSWTLEIEPSNSSVNGRDQHPTLPAFGADYGGFANNGADGFILPESEIRRVREQLAETFMVTWYGQAGPPSITQLRIIDHVSQAIVFDAEWDITAAGTRELYTQYYDEIIADNDYSLLIRFDKPMRYRNDAGDIDNLPGQNTGLNPTVLALNNDNDVPLNLSNHRWVNEKDNGWESYGYYKDDTFVVDFKIDPAINAADDGELTWRLFTTDMVGQSTDADPSTAVTWAGGQWQNYEDSNGNASINGGLDTTITINVSNQGDFNYAGVPDTALYFDATRSGEGFTLEFIDGANDFLVQWFTYDDQGNQQWYLDTDKKTAENALLAKDILLTEGGVFGPGFDNNNIDVFAAGDIEMIFGEFKNGRRTGQMKYTYPDGRKFRTQVDQLTAAKGISSEPNTDPPVEPSLTAASIIGSWFDPSRNGEGFHIEQIQDDSVVFLWYGYELDGSKKWFIGSGGVVTETIDNINITFDEVYTTSGGIFGAEFNTDEVISTVWGSAEFNMQCSTGTFSFNALNPEYGSGTYQLVPITRPINNRFRCE